MNNEETQMQEEKVDLKGLFYRYYSHWYYFLASIFIFSIIAFAYIRYSKKFIPDEDYAKFNKLGMWSMEFDYPWEWRKKN